MTDQAEAETPENGPGDYSDPATIAQLEAEAAGEDGGGQKADQGQSMDTAETLEAVIGPVFDIAAPAWGITKSEKKQLALAWQPVVDKYFPDMDLGVELQAVLVTAMVIGPRVNTPPKPLPKEAANDPQGPTETQKQPPAGDNAATGAANRNLDLQAAANDATAE